MLLIAFRSNFDIGETSQWRNRYGNFFCMLYICNHSSVSSYSFVFRNTKSHKRKPLDNCITLFWSRHIFGSKKTWTSFCPILVLAERFDQLMTKTHPRKRNPTNSSRRIFIAYSLKQQSIGAIHDANACKFVSSQWLRTKISVRSLRRSAHYLELRSAKRRFRWATGHQQNEEQQLIEVVVVRLCPPLLQSLPTLSRVRAKERETS